jgi:hypothetical protein
MGKIESEDIAIFAYRNIFSFLRFPLIRSVNQVSEFKAPQGKKVVKMVSFNKFSLSDFAGAMLAKGY